MFRVICFAAAAAAGAQAAFAAEPAVVLAPASNWHLDYAEQSCRLARTFGDSERRSVAFFTQHGPSGTFEMTLAGAPLKRFVANRDMSTQFGPIGAVWDLAPFKGDVEGVGPALIYSSINLKAEDEDEGEGEGEEKVDEAPLPATTLPTIAVALAKGMEYVEVSQRDLRIRFATGALDTAFAALNACSEDLISTWGLDVEQHRSLTRTVQWTNSEEIVARIMRDYPPKALRKGEQGIVRALLLVDDKGAVDRCKLANATNAEALPAPACRALEDAVFEPALDREGQPMRSFYLATIVYKLG